MNPLISVVIPTRRHEPVTTAVESLARQTIQDLEIHVIVDNEGRGQAWARNQGIERALGRYILFSDSDIDWLPDALERLLRTLEGAPSDDQWRPGYAYGPYQFSNGSGELVGAQPWSWRDLQANNYISTMCLFRASCGPHFDEQLRRLEDWELFLRMGFSGICGAWEPNLIFRTAIRPGISFGGPLTHEQAEQQVRWKHRSWLKPRRVA